MAARTGLAPQVPASAAKVRGLLAPSLCGSGRQSAEPGKRLMWRTSQTTLAGSRAPQILANNQSIFEQPFRVAGRSSSLLAVAKQREQSGASASRQLAHLAKIASATAQRGAPTFASAKPRFAAKATPATTNSRLRQGALFARRQYHITSSSSTSLATTRRQQARFAGSPSSPSSSSSSSSSSASSRRSSAIVAKAVNGSLGDNRAFKARLNSSSSSLELVRPTFSPPTRQQPRAIGNTSSKANKLSAATSQAVIGRSSRLRSCELNEPTRLSAANQRRTGKQQLALAGADESSSASSKSISSSISISGGGGGSSSSSSSSSSCSGSISKSSGSKFSLTSSTSSLSLAVVKRARQSPTASRQRLGSRQISEADTKKQRSSRGSLNSAGIALGQSLKAFEVESDYSCAKSLRRRRQISPAHSGDKSAIGANCETANELVQATDGGNKLTAPSNGYSRAEGDSALLNEAANHNSSKSGTKPATARASSIANVNTTTTINPEEGEEENNNNNQQQQQTNNLTRKTISDNTDQSNEQQAIDRPDCLRSPHRAGNESSNFSRLPSIVNNSIRHNSQNENQCRTNDDNEENHHEDLKDNRAPMILGQTRLVTPTLPPPIQFEAEQKEGAKIMEVRGFSVDDNKENNDSKRTQSLAAPEIQLRSEPINAYYDLETRPFARGKFAQVKRCTNKLTRQCFAAKCIKKRRRLVDIRHEILLEIEALKLSYLTEHIVKIYDVYESQNEMILILEMAGGGELQRVLDDEEAIEEHLVKQMIGQLLEGLVHLHDNEIAHLDIKPQNILLTEPFPLGKVKLCDFGISRRITKECEIREICGTPDYVAPEILRYDPISLATDMWSLGVLTYVLLSGYSPFGSEQKQQTFCNITQAALDFPGEIFDKISKEAIDFMQKLIVREPSERLTSRQARNHPWLLTNNRSHNLQR